MHDNVIAMPAPTMRQAGFLEKALSELKPSQWANRRETLAAAYNRCPRVRMILSRNADKFGVDMDDLKQDVWMVFEQKMLPILDSPSNVYSVLYRCSELCSRSLLNSVRESTLTVGSDEDVEEVMHRLLESNGPEGMDLDTQIEVELDTQKARLAVQQKLNKFGWPEGIPREESAYRRAGRPLKESGSVNQDKDEGAMMTKNASIMFQKSVVIKEGDRDAAKAFIATLERPAQQNLTDAAKELGEMRVKLQVPVERFAEILGSRADTIRALLYGTHVNDELTLQHVKTARRALTELRKNPDMALLLKSDMVKIVKRWRLAWGMADDVLTLKAVAEQTGRKYATIYRWYVDNRKPVNVFDLYEIDTLVRVLTKKMLKEVKEVAAASMAKPARPLNAKSTPAATKSSVAKKAAAKAAAARDSAVKKAPAKPAAKKVAAKKAVKTASRRKG